MKRSCLAVLYLACFLSVSTFGCGKTGLPDPSGESRASAVVTIGYLPITHALTVFQEKELLDATADGISIKLQKFNSWSDLTDALNAGNIDGASVLIELAMSAKSKGIDLKAVALGHRDGNVVVVSKNINSVEDLKGKTNAIPSTQSSHNILIQDALARGNLTLDDVKIVQISPTETPFSLASGAIDCFCVAEPFGAQAVSQGFGKVLFHSDELWQNSLCCCLVLNQSFIDSFGPDNISKLVQKYHEAGSSLDSEAAAEVAKKYLGQSHEILETSLRYIQFDNLSISKEDYDALAERVKKYDINRNPPSYEEFVYQAE